jgi:hypothetical protein
VEDTNGNSTAVPAVKTKKKPNSPKAPGTSLRSAVNEVTKIYERYSHGSFSRGEMASALGMSANSGAFLGKAATLKEYGLIDETGGSARVSDLFKAMYQAPAGSAELKRNALQAVKTPAVFARLLTQFSQKVPDVAALALRLETQERFNRDRAGAVANAFRTSMTEYGLIDGNGNVLPVRDGPVDARADADEEADDDADVADPKMPALPTIGMFRMEVPLGTGRKAVLALPDDLTAADTKKICAILGAYAAE